MAKQKIKKPVVPGKSSKAQLFRIFRYVVYALLIIIAFRGVRSFFVPSSVVNQNLSIAVAENDAAQSFAEAFARSYYTIQPRENDAYREQLEPFIAKGLSANTIGMSVNMVSKTYNVQSTLAWDVHTVSDSRADIDVRVDIEQTDNGATENLTRYLRVPIEHNANGYVVYDYPTVIPAPALPSGDVATYPELSETNEVITEQVKLALEDFLKAYSTDPASKLRYFMENGEEIQGYEGQLMFDAIREIRVLLPAGSSGQTAAVSHVKAYVTSEWIDGGQITQLQHHTVDLIFKEDRWYIQTFQGGFKE